jgi:hypothetical protein
VKTWTPAPTGLLLSAAAGLGAFSNAASVACGDVTQCNGPGGRGVPAVGATFWVKRFLAAEVAYMAPARLSTTGSGTNFRFANTVTTDVVLIVANAGGQAGPVRLYALGGPTYQESVSSTTQTVSATAANPAAVGTSAFKATGWGWVAGGGVERWMRTWLGVYAEGARVVLKGKAVEANEQGTLDDTMIVVTAGVRVHIGR